MINLKYEILLNIYMEKPLSILEMNGVKSSDIITHLSILQSEASIYYSDRKLYLTQKGANLLQNYLKQIKVIKLKKEHWIKPLVEIHKEKKSFDEVYLPLPIFDK